MARMEGNNLEQHGHQRVVQSPTSLLAGSFPNSNNKENALMVTHEELVALIRQEATKVVINSSNVTGSSSGSTPSDDDDDDDNGGNQACLQEEVAPTQILQPLMLGETQLAGAAATPTTPTNQDTTDVSVSVTPMLPKDTYSLAAFSPLYSSSFFLSIVVMIMQAFSLSIILFDQLTSGKPSNRLGIPAYTSVAVRLTQVLSLSLTVVYQTDTLWAINIFFKGYHKFSQEVEKVTTNFYKKKSQQKEKEEPAKATTGKDGKDGDHNGQESDTDDVFPPVDVANLQFRWYFSNALRFCQGLYCLVIMFMLIMKANTGRDVLLSFNIINFVAGFDNAIFVLAQWGYFSDPIKRSCDHPLIGDVNMDTLEGDIEAKIDVQAVLPIRKNQSDQAKPVCSRRLAWKTLRTLTVVAIWSVLVAFWLWLTIRQAKGEFLPQSVYVQFGDVENAALGLYSGLYDVWVEFDTVRYVARSDPDGPGVNVSSIKQFQRCQTSAYWGFQGQSLSQAAASPYHVCEDWLVKSSSTASFDITDVANEKWTVVIDQDGRREVQMNYMRMLPSPGPCPSEPEPIYGPQCEFRDPCKALAMDGMAFNTGATWAVYGLYPDDSQKNNTVIVSQYYGRGYVDNAEEGYVVYAMLSDPVTGVPVYFYGRPVWYASLNTTDAGGNATALENNATAYEAIANVGRRWARLIVAIPGPDNTTGIAEKVLLVEALLSKVGGEVKASQFITHFSDSFNVGSKGDTGLPVGLNWYLNTDNADFRPDYSRPVEGDATLQCKCTVCPNGTYAITDDYLDIPVEITMESSSLFGEANLTCRSIQESSTSVAAGTTRCASLQMASIFNCGCPAVPPTEQKCPLCTDGSSIDDSMWEGPTVTGPSQGNLTCGELLWALSLEGDSFTDNDNFCPSYQATYGPLCGCADSPPQRCEITCESNTSFHDDLPVEYFPPDPSLNGTKCRQLVGIESSRFEDCPQEWTTLLLQECCVDKDQA